MTSIFHHVKTKFPPALSGATATAAGRIKAGYGARCRRRRDIKLAGLLASQANWAAFGGSQLVRMFALYTGPTYLPAGRTSQ